MNLSTTRHIMIEHTDPSAAPSRRLLWLESRAAFEFWAYVAMVPMWRLAPTGDGHAVLVLPGLSADDRSTRPLRAFLNERGWRAHGWKLGPNHGPRAGVEPAIQRRLAELHDRYGRKVSLIGWSLGGILAREAARRAPQHVRSVVTLGSPFAGVPRASNAWRLYEALSGRAVDDGAAREAMQQPPPVPSTAIYSRSDGIVAWQGCLERESPTTENIEVDGSHCGLGHHPAVLYAVADRLALPEGDWRPFERSALRSFVYPDPRRDTAMA
ncbi:MAG TPA: alpha/beta fold hydrolase [Rubrivivax sp.]|nr:alpha/beta fold hydrolase [Rubrivivax sp.]